MPEMPETQTLFVRLAVALALGLLIGVERGWKTRDLEPGQRVAGVRTFAVVGLLGGLSALLTLLTAPATLAAALVGAGLLLGLNHWYTLSRGQDIGSTTVVAALATFALGALAGFGQLAVSAAGAVVLTALLGVKRQLHALVARIEARELAAAVELLAISVVVLPVLPDRAFGPFDALNPYRIWWMVVLIAALSSLGYLTIKLAGPRRGVLLTGLMGGLASSTVTSINLARLAKGGEPQLQPLLAAGAVAAVATMYPRVLVIVAAVAPALLAELALPLGLATLAALVSVAWRARQTGPVDDPQALQPRNPFELTMALQFAAILTLVMLAARALRAWAGDAGLFALAAVSGLSDVDAIVLSLGTMLHDGETAARTATQGVLLAVLANTAVKPALIAAVGAPRMALHTLPPLIAAAAAAALGLLLPGWLPAP
jgi:uncharacterized membrane protein (DUF4010 family)